MIATLETQAEFARRLGVVRSRISAYKDAGRLVMVDDKVDVEASIARIESTRSPAHDEQSPRAATPPAPPAATADDKIGNSYQAARAVKERYLALEAKRAYELACGQLLPAATVAAAVADAATTLRGRLEALPDLLAVQIAGLGDEAQIRAVMANTIEHILTDLSAAMAKIGDTNG